MCVQICLWTSRSGAMGVFLSILRDIFKNTLLAPLHEVHIKFSCLHFFQTTQFHGPATSLIPLDGALSALYLRKRYISSRHHKTFFLTLRACFTETLS